ncbi:MAG TPA: hypothetical protein VJ933_05740, partial [Phaeodactylibacter sp.]|nr:hypothetical protein [Phaeodactylibacter sp.]
LVLFLVYQAYKGLTNATPESQLILLKSVFFLLLLLGVLAYLLSIRLSVKVDEKKIKYQFFPLHYKKQKIYWEEVESYEIVNPPLPTQLSGWGVHFWERMFCVNRNAGLRLQLKDGQRIFISCKSPSTLDKTLRQIGKTTA